MSNKKAKDLATTVEGTQEPIIEETVPQPPQSLKAGNYITHFLTANGDVLSLDPGMVINIDFTFNSTGTTLDLTLSNLVSMLSPADFKLVKFVRVANHDAKGEMVSILMYEIKDYEAKANLSYANQDLLQYKLKIKAA